MAALAILEEELNGRLAELKAALKAHLSEPDYSSAIDAIAKAIHSTLAEACSSGFEVRAEKDNGRILKMGLIGPIKGTSVRYQRFPTSLEETCELAVTVRFTLVAST